MRGNVSYMILIVLLVAYIIIQGVGIGAPSSTTTVCVDPPKIVDRVGGMAPGSEFSVYVNVTDITELYAWSFRMIFDPSILNVTNAELGTWLHDASGWPVLSMPIRIRNDLGYVFLGQMLDMTKDPTNGANGTGNLATITFQVIGSGVTTLELDSTALNTVIAGQKVKIEHVAEDGLFDNRPVIYPPTALFDAEPLVAEVNETITFDASASNDEADGGWIESYYWDFGDGTNATGVVVTHAYASEGNYIVTLAVTDNDGETDTATADITIGHDIAVTSVSTSHTTVIPGVSVAINVTVVNNRGFTETFNVTILYDDTAIETQTDITLAAGANTTLTFTWDTTGMPEGDYTINGVASNVTNEINTGNNKNNCTITISSFNIVHHPPIEVGGVTFHVTTKSNSTISDFNFIQADKKIRFDVTRLPGYPSATYFCNVTIPNNLLGGPYTVLIDDSPATPDPVVTTNSTHSFLYFAFTLSIREVQIIGTNVATPPVAIFTPSTTSPVVGDTTIFNASESYDPDGTVVSYYWDFGDDTTKSGEIVEHAYTATGTYTVTLTVKDNNELTSEPTQKMITVRALQPPIATFTYSPETPVVVGETVTFNASASDDPDGGIISYAWNFGDGSSVVTETDPITTHTYTASGTHVVTLTVTDNDGLTDDATQSIAIGKMNSTVSIALSSTSVTVGENTTISGSIDPIREGVTVTIWYRLSGEEVWNSLTTVQTDENSQYSYVWAPESAGTYEIRASWEGDENTFADETGVQELTVREAGPNVPLSLIAVAVAMILTVIIVAYFMRARKTA